MPINPEVGFDTLHYEQYLVKYRLKGSDGVWTTLEELMYFKGKGAHRKIERYLQKKYGKSINVLSIKFC